LWVRDRDRVSGRVRVTIQSLYRAYRAVVPAIAWHLVMTHGVDTFAPGNLELANCITREETFNFYINYFKTSTVSLKLSCEVCIFSCFVLVGFRSNGPFL